MPRSLRPANARGLFAALVGILLILGDAASGQVGLSPTVDLFGDDIVQKLPERNVRGGIWMFGNNGATRRNSFPRTGGFEHILTFQDGRQIRGTLVSLTTKDVTWRRPDADVVLVFPRDQVRRVILVLPESNQLPGFGIPGIEMPAAESTDKPMATVKLPGGDWLHGEVVSSDGENLAVKMADDTEFRVHRSQVRWLHLGSAPAPAFGFGGGDLEMEGWFARGAGELEVKDGVATLEGGGWIGRAMAPMTRFEVSFEIPKEAEDQTHVWLQPLGPEVNCYTTGTIVLRLSSTALNHCIYANKMQDVRTAIPPDPEGWQGPVRYRVLYDGPSQKLRVFRNGRQLGDFRFIEEKNDQMNRQNPQFMVNGICFQRERGSKTPMKISGLQVQPWVGDAESSPAGQGDTLMLADSTSQLGTLGAIGRTDFYFSGTKRERTKETLLQFANDPKPLTGTDAVLLFGEKGELSVASLEISGGKMRCRTAFSPALDMAVSGLRTIAFRTRTTDSETDDPDLLIFKNGDELPGQLISAADGAPLKWQLPSAQQISFSWEVIAGVRLGKKADEAAKAQESGSGAFVELRNGDVIRGEIGPVASDTISFHHQALGRLVVKRADVNVLLPNGAATVVDGGYSPDSWMARPTPAAGGSEPVLPQGRSWVYLDGTYILRPQRVSRMSSESPSLYPPIGKALDRFELRCDVTDPSGNDPGFAINLQEPQGAMSLQASFSYGRLQMFVNSRKPRGGPNWRHVMLEGKVPEPRSRRRVRLFIDAKKGTADIFLDGVLISRVGQQESERMPGLGGRIQIYAQGASQVPLVFSNLWLGPWNGELPTTTSAPAGVALTNGDFATGTLGEFTDGKVRMESEIGPLELPVDKVVSVTFGTSTEPAKAAARIRFRDGTAVHVDSYKFAEGKLVAKSPLLGEINADARVIAEIVVRPPPVRPPQTVLAKKEDAKLKNDEPVEQQ
jgi:hypothetical protein